MARKHIKVLTKKLGKSKVWGQADYGDYTIEIDPRLKGKKHLEILIHEALHLLNPTFEEDEVVDQSIALTNLLWKQMYRRVELDNKIPLQDGEM